MFALIQGAFHLLQHLFLPQTRQKHGLFLCRLFLDCHVNILFITNSECVKSHKNHLNECPFKATIVASFIPQNADAEKQTILKTAL